MLFHGKIRNYNNYKIKRDICNENLDKYKMLRNSYYKLYGPTDLDVVNISLLKIELFLEKIMFMAYFKKPAIRAKIAEMRKEKLN